MCSRIRGSSSLRGTSPCLMVKSESFVNGSKCLYNWLRVPMYPHLHRLSVGWSCLIIVVNLIDSRVTNWNVWTVLFKSFDSCLKCFISVCAAVAVEVYCCYVFRHMFVGVCCLCCVARSRERVRPISHAPVVERRNKLLVLSVCVPKADTRLITFSCCQENVSKSLFGCWDYKIPYRNAMFVRALRIINSC